MIIHSRNVWNEIKAKFEPGFLTISKDRIESIEFGDPSRSKNLSKVVDYGRFHIFASAIDLHVHSRDFKESHKQRFEELDAQAHRGGVSTMACMANTQPRMDSVQYLKEFFKRAQKLQAKLIPFATVTKNLDGELPTDWEALLKLPIAGLSDDGKPVMNEKIFRGALLATKKAKKLFSLHEEDLSISRSSQLQFSESSIRLGIEGSSDESEASMVERDIRIAGELKASVHFGHLSSRRSVEILRAARKNKIAFSAELTPHHGLLSVENAETLKPTDLSLMKVCPVIREDADRRALLLGLSQGVIDCLASDHAPHSNFDKNLPYSLAAHGMISMENYLPLYNELRLQGKISWGVFLKALSGRPAELLGLKNEGTLLKGSIASIAVFDPDSLQSLKWTRSQAQNTPFQNRKVHGRVIAHYLKGKKVFDEG